MQSLANSKESVQSKTADYFSTDTEDQTAYLSKVNFLDAQKDEQATGISRGLEGNGENGALSPVRRLTLDSVSNIMIFFL